jgi:thiamine-phosphate pyrophosphorylase
MRLSLPPLYPIVDLTTCPLSIQKVMEVLAASNFNMIQLREKTASSKRLFEDTLRSVECAERFRMQVIVNDRADLAWLAEAHGVHLGQEDLPVEQARKILGMDKIIGVSSHNLHQALAAERSMADYVAIGPVFPTLTKENPNPLVSRQELGEIRKRVTKPLVAIGGITTENAGTLFELGIDSVAVIRDLFASSDFPGKVKAFARVARISRD